MGQGVALKKLQWKSYRQGIPEQGRINITERANCSLFGRTSRNKQIKLEGGSMSCVGRQRLEPLKYVSSCKFQRSPGCTIFLTKIYLSCN